MKKFFALFLAMMMVLSLVACGSSDSSETEESTETTEAGITDEQLAALTDAYNETAAYYTEAATLIETNGWMADQTTVDEINAVGETLSVIGQALTEDITLLDGSDFDALPDAVLSCIPALEEIIARVSEPYEMPEDSALTADNEGTNISDEQLVALANAYNQVAPLYNEAYTLAEANGWLADEQTVAEINALSGTLGVIGQALSEDLSMLDGANIDELVPAMEAFVPALEEMIARVSAPYAG